MSDLWNTPKKADSAYREQLLEQYKLFHATIERISDRRQQTNGYFITINTLFISFIGVISKETGLLTSPLWLAVLSLVGILICRSWYRALVAYKHVNKAKFAVLHEIEERFPMNLFKYEWEKMGRGENKKEYATFTGVELHIPAMFGVVYLALLLVFIFQFSAQYNLSWVWDWLCAATK